MDIFIGILIFLGTFSIMEFMAWFTHKYVMHGFLWVLHKDHHRKDHDSWFERNDAFFIFYAVISMSCFYISANTTFWYAVPIGFGIMAYGAAYFLAHKMHHKHLGKGDGECFGMLLVPFKYFKK